MALQRMKDAAEKKAPFPRVNDALGTNQPYPVGLSHHTSGKDYHMNGKKYKGPMRRNKIMGA